MISQKIKKYIAEHSFCSDFLFKDWESFLMLLYAEGGHVESILWWDHCKKAEQHLSVGGGGYNDPEDPEYMYAEMQLFEDGLETKTLNEIMDYIISVKKRASDTVKNISVTSLYRPFSWMSDKFLLVGKKNYPPKGKQIPFRRVLLFVKKLPYGVQVLQFRCQFCCKKRYSPADERLLCSWYDRQRPKRPQEGSYALTLCEQYYRIPYFSMM